MKYVIIDAAKAKVGGTAALDAPDQILAHEATPLNVPANDATTTTTTKTTTVTNTTTTMTTVEPTRLNGKFLRLRIREENFGLR